MSIILILVLAIIFISLIVLIIKNRQKVWAQGVVLVSSIASFISSIYLYSHGNSLNSSFDNQMQSLWETGRTNPGDSYINTSLYFALLGAVLLIIFLIFVFKYTKKSNTKIEK